MKKTLLSVAAILLLSCNPKKDAKKFPLLEKADWFLGEWKNQSKEGNFTEKWEKLSDSTFMGVSYIISKNDTVFHENIVLEQKNDSLFYNVSIEKNKEEITTFHLTAASKDKLTFENATNYFPNKIIYQRITSDSIVATIEGKVNGKATSELFPMKKKQ